MRPHHLPILTLLLLIGCTATRTSPATIANPGAVISIRMLPMSAIKAAHPDYSDLGAFTGYDMRGDLYIELPNDADPETLARLTLHEVLLHVAQCKLDPAGVAACRDLLRKLRADSFDTLACAKMKEPR